MLWPAAARVGLLRGQDDAPERPIRSSGGHVCGDDAGEVDGGDVLEPEEAVHVDGAAAVVVTGDAVAALFGKADKAEVASALADGTLQPLATRFNARGVLKFEGAVPQTMIT